MADFVFTSPGVKFRERDLSFVVRNLGVTTLGLVGETQKGPAFEPIFIQDAGQFRTRFGGQSIERFGDGSLKYQLPYVANAYLSESNQLYVTRVLGLSGYEAGTAWALILSAGVDPSTTGDTANVTVTTGVTFSGNTYLGVTLDHISDTGSVFSGFTKITDTAFSGVRYDFIVTSYSNGAGTVDVTGTTVTGTSYGNYENMVLAVIRSRASVEDIENASPSTVFDADSLTIISNDTLSGVGDFFGEFELRAANSNDGSVETYIASLNPNSRNFLPNVIGDKPKGKNTKIWVEAVYPDLLKKLDAEGIAYGVQTTVIEATTDAFTNYKEQFKSPETPWIVSELKGNKVERLFKFISISDGNAANREIKISIQNIDPINKEFDVVIRDFNDTDVKPIVLEAFTRCSMRKGENGYVGNRIGTIDGNYSLRSNYVMLEINEDADITSFPAGFEGYYQKDWAASATSDGTNAIAPKIFYKTSYNSDERYNKVYLGISENAYSTSNSVGTGINQNLFNYNGRSGFVKTKGFHMDSGATGTYYVGLSGVTGSSVIGEFEVGAGRFRNASDVQSGDVYEDIRSRKFTLVPAGGFDGWDEHRIVRSNTDLYRKGGIYDGVPDGATPSNDFQAWKTAILTFANPEEVTINVFATPGINWSRNLLLVQETIEMIENDRTDSLYIIDAPDSNASTSIDGERIDIVVANEIVDLFESTGIDSSYAATYYPWIQMQDSENNVNVYLPPTGEVVKAIAFTDKVKYPWFAPAGTQRGATDARKSKYKLSEEARDILYNVNINPLADYADVGTIIFGQKTLQSKETALNRINVRRLLLQAKVLISNVAVRLLFEQNDQTTIDEFLSKVNPILDSIRRERGLEEFRVKMDDSINSPESRDRNELYGEIYLKPTKSLEFIGIGFTITPSGASFDELGT